MKAAPFDYLRADSLEQALHELARHGGDAKLIAGGQSLVPMMAMRLARPSVLVDIHRLAELRGWQVAGDAVRLRAASRQCEVEADAGLAGAVPLLRAALRWVGHQQTRNRGTVGGSLVHADPAAELPLAAAVLQARLHLRSERTERCVDAADFALGPMFTTLADDECLVAIDWPTWSVGEGEVLRCEFDETAIRHGDFAMASVAVQLVLDASGVCRRAAIGLGGVDATPLAFPDLAAQLHGRRIDASSAAEVAQAAAARCQPGSDMHADAEYRRHLGAALLQRALLRAAGEPVAGAAF